METAEEFLVRRRGQEEPAAREYPRLVHLHDLVDQERPATEDDSGDQRVKQQGQQRDRPQRASVELSVAQQPRRRHPRAGQQNGQQDAGAE